MRLLVKEDENYAEIFRVGFYKSRHWSVIGEYLLFDILESMIENGKSFHSHFIYVETGDYHFSIKYYDTHEEMYVDRKTYHNHVAIRKKHGNSNFVKDDPIERRDRNFDDPLDSFMMGEKLKPWDERPLGHHFGTVALNLNVNGQTKLEWNSKIKPTEDDLVVDLKLVAGNVINFGAGIFDDTNPAFKLSGLPDNVSSMEKTTAQNGLILRLNVIIEKTNLTVG